MNSRIREIVMGHVGPNEALIRALEAYHEKSTVDAIDGALMGQRALDRALGRDASLASIGIGPGAVYVTHGVVSVSCGEKDDEFAKALRRELALGRDASLDVRPGAQSPGDAVRDYVAGMVDDLRLRRDQMRRQRDVQDIIERNAPEWQHGSDAAKGSGVCTCCGHAFSAPACSMSHAMIAHERGCGGESDDERARR